MNQPVAVWWIKRDFRLTDNDALGRALEQADHVVPIFIFEPNLLKAEETSVFHVWSWINALQDVRKKLLERGGTLWCGFGSAIDIFGQLKKRLNLTHVFSHEEIGTELTYSRDRQMLRWFSEQSIQWIEIQQTGVFRRFINRDQRNARWKKFVSSNIKPTPDVILCPEFSSTSCLQNSIPSLQDLGLQLPNQDKLQPVSESVANKTIDDFLNRRGKWYSGNISSPNTAFWAGSRLSPHLAWGTISIRRIYQQTLSKQAEFRDDESEEGKRWRRSLRSFSSRLHWRDHFMQRLEDEPAMEFYPLNSIFVDLPYENKQEYLQAWLNGQTGIPLVDACMRCLQHRGFLNFRMRSMVVSAACHALWLDWRTIMYPLARLFTDYEPGIHMSQLQMQAGVVGINTLRLYSPAKQLKDQDAEAKFVKAWVPELEKYPAEMIEHYESIPLLGYPVPIVDVRARQKIMAHEIYRRKRSSSGQAESQKVLKKHGSRVHRDRNNISAKSKPKRTSKNTVPENQLSMW